jgi:hypothetical protein
LGEIDRPTHTFFSARLLLLQKSKPEAPKSKKVQGYCVIILELFCVDKKAKQPILFPDIIF